MTRLKTKHLPRLLASLAAVAAVLAVAACGGSDNDTPAGNDIDLAFVDEMLRHHEGAIEMAKIAKQRAESDYIEQLAGEIITAQENEMGLMSTARSEFEKAGLDKGDLGMPADQMGMDMDPSMLKTAKPFDKAFIDMMIPHHQGAIRMARVELDLGDSPALKQLAQQIIDAQSAEIEAMNDHRQAVFGRESPAGGVPPAKDSAVVPDGSNTTQGMDHSSH